MATVSADRRRLLEQMKQSQGGRGGKGGKGGGRTRTIIGWVLAVIAILALFVVFVMWASGAFSTPPEILEVRSAVNLEIEELNKVARNEKPFSSDFSGTGKVFETMRNLPPEMRDDARAEMERLFNARERAETQSFFALPPQDRQKELDRRIKEEEDRRQAWMKQREERAAQRDAERPRDRENGQGQGREGRGDRGDRAGGGGGRGGPGGGGGGPGGRGGSEEARNAARKARLDGSSAEERAQRTEYRRQIEDRRKALGLPPGRGGR